MSASYSSPSLTRKLFGWLDSDYFPQGAEAVYSGPQKAELTRYLPFIFLHLGCLGAFWTGMSPIAVGVAVALYWVRMFAITAFYHRYFSHRTFSTSRLMQCLFAILGLMAVQRGPLWWAAHHRHHHRASDDPTDTHSPRQRGLWWAHIGWIACSANMPTRYERLPDFAKFPELRFLNRFDWLVPLLLFLGLYVGGEALNANWPQLNTSGWQLVVWGFFISTTVLFHATGTINSLSHVLGRRRYDTTDDSRNNWLLAIITMGEGWHNNHHMYQGSVRQGFYWWEVDATYYVLWLMSKIGLIWDLHPVPAAAYAKADATRLPEIPVTQIQPANS